MKLSITPVTLPHPTSHAPHDPASYFHEETEGTSPGSLGHCTCPPARVPCPILGTALGLSSSSRIMYFSLSTGHSISIGSHFSLFQNKLARPRSRSTSAQFSASITAKLLQEDAPVARLPSFSDPGASPRCRVPSSGCTGGHPLPLETCQDSKFLVLPPLLAASSRSALPVPPRLPGPCNARCAWDSLHPSPFLHLSSLPL